MTNRQDEKQPIGGWSATFVGFASMSVLFSFLVGGLTETAFQQQVEELWKIKFLIYALFFALMAILFKRAT